MYDTWIAGGDAYLTIQAMTQAAASVQYIAVTVSRLRSPPMNARAAASQLQLAIKSRRERELGEYISKIGLSLPCSSPSRRELVCKTVVAQYMDGERTWFEQWPYNGPIPPESGKVVSPSPASSRNAKQPARSPVARVKTWVTEEQDVSIDDQTEEDENELGAISEPNQSVVISGRIRRASPVDEASEDSGSQTNTTASSVRRSASSKK